MGRGSRYKISEEVQEKLSSFYIVKDEFSWEEGNPVGDRKNENKPTKSFETVNEGFYQDEEEEKRIEEEKQTNMQS